VLGKTAKYYKENPEARKKRNEYQKQYNKSDKQVAKRVELNRENRRRGTYGNGDGMDLSHTKRGFVMKRASENRGDTNDMSGDKKSRGKNERKK
jgi:hypothetical protein